MDIFNFEKLTVWNKSRQLVKVVYELTSKFPQSERFGLCNQLGKAVISVPSNIAEGSSRSSMKEQLHFYEIAYGSLMEVLTQLILSQDLGYIAYTELDSCRTLISEIARMISGMKRHLCSNILK